jgi:hypothetical protein
VERSAFRGLKQTWFKEGVYFDMIVRFGKQVSQKVSEPEYIQISDVQYLRMWVRELGNIPPIIVLVEFSHHGWSLSSEQVYPICARNILEPAIDLAGD